jgi:hypothetical protein
LPARLSLQEGIVIITVTEGGQRVATMESGDPDYRMKLAIAFLTALGLRTGLGIMFKAETAEDWRCFEYALIGIEGDTPAKRFPGAAELAEVQS